MSSPADDHPDHAPARPLHRRDLLKAGALLGAAAALHAVPARVRAAQPTPAPVPAAAGRARNLIVLVSDGMSTGTLTLADMHRRRVDNRPSAWCALWSRPGVRRASMMTHSLSSLVTDSAAAGTAWGSGRKVNNGAVNVLPDGSQLVPILLSAMQAGKRTGLVTTTRVTHATPAAFIANAPARDMENLIASQMLGRKVDVILGGGERHFPADLLAAHPDLRLARTRDQLAAAPRDGRLLGLFDASHLPYVADRGPHVPTLAELADAALARLDGAPEGFVLQIEGGRVDHAAHANDAAALLREQLDLDDAIARVVDWLAVGDRARDTLVLITSDHGNANPGLAIYNEPAARGFASLAKAPGSFERIEAFLKRAGSPDAAAPGLGSCILEATGHDLSPEQLEMVLAPLRGKRVIPFSGLNSWSGVLGSILADRLGVSFNSGNHTSDLVELTAMGPGSERFTGCLDNTELHTLAMAAMDIPDGRPLPDMLEKISPRREPKGD